MPPRRRKDKHLPPCVYRKHGAYYHVHENKWTRIGVTLPEALAAYARLIDAPLSDMQALLDRVLADAAARNLAAGTQTQYRRAVEKLKIVLAEFEPHEVKPHHIAQIMDAWRDTPNMANRCLSVLRMAFSIAVRTGVIDTNPCADIGRHREGKRDRYITHSEYQAIHKAAPSAMRAIMDLAYLTAQRIGDVLTIRESDLTDEGIEFRQQKTGKRLCVAWTPALRAAVAAARALRTHRALILLSLKDGRKRSYRGVRDLWDRACTRAGVEDAHLHDIRAKSLTDARKQGLDAQRLAGHTTEAQTVRYLRDREVDLVAGPNRLFG
ncbi:MAG: tyrosine-type recombinase/integrase [Thiohalocapsa sp.]